MKWLVSASALMLWACTHIGYREITGPDGTPIYEASCSGHHATFGDCMNQAAQACGGPYGVLDKDANQDLVVTPQLAATRTKRTMLFRCRNVGMAGPRLGVGLNDERGHVVVTSLYNNSAADIAGIQAGDRIETVNGVEVHTTEDVTSAVDRATDQVRVGICRDGTCSEVDVHLAPTH